MQLERYVHNSDYYYFAFNGVRDPRMDWVDLSGAGVAEWNYKNFIFNAKLAAIRSLNYQWGVIEDITQLPYIKRDVWNLHGQLGISYYFH